MRFEVKVPCWIQFDDLIIPHGIETLFRNFAFHQKYTGTGAVIEAFIEEYAEMYISLLVEPTKRDFVVFKPRGWVESKNESESGKYPYDLKDLTDRVKEAVRFKLSHTPHEQLFVNPISRTSKSISFNRREFLRRQIMWCISSRKMCAYYMVIEGSLPYFRSFDTRVEPECYSSAALSLPTATNLTLGMLHTCYLHDLHRGNLRDISEHLDPKGGFPQKNLGLRCELVLDIYIENPVRWLPRAQRSGGEFLVCDSYRIEKFRIRRGKTCNLFSLRFLPTPSSSQMRKGNSTV